MKKIILTALLMNIMGQAMAHSQSGKSNQGCHSHGQDLAHCH
ncbi:hypothetical protein [Acinetobacter sp. B51(2017)]|nr:hypothetical protein [Acinetobacter sp. B51(2017)]